MLCNNVLVAYFTAFFSFYPLFSGRQIGTILAFCTALVRNLKVWRDGTSASGVRKSTSNKTLRESMDDLRSVGDLQCMQSSGTAFDEQVSAMMAAAPRLVAKKLIPQSAKAPASSILEAIVVLRRGGRDRSNKALLKEFYKHGDKVQTIIDLVMCVWLLSPPRSSLYPWQACYKFLLRTDSWFMKTAAQELIIRWNGPGLDDSDMLIKAVQKQRKYDH